MYPYVQSPPVSVPPPRTLTEPEVARLKEQFDLVVHHGGGMPPAVVGALLGLTVTTENTAWFRHRLGRTLGVCGGLEV